VLWRRGSKRDGSRGRREPHAGYLGVTGFAPALWGPTHTMGAPQPGGR